MITSLIKVKLNYFVKVLTLALMAVMFAGSFLWPFVTAAQGSLSLSISPTLFEMTANPDDRFVSVVRVINPNPFDITVTAEPVNFMPKGEGGEGVFRPIENEDDQTSTLAGWIFLESTIITVAAEQTAEVPFTIEVPEDAPPGGHFAAMLIGTKSLGSDENRNNVETSQVVTSLVFLRVTGDINESGSIREFRSVDKVVERPEVDFSLRFQNDGNVHILPQGEIRIFNMWGQERGVLPVNRQTMFGNVLPDSIREYRFNWSGEWSLADMGRYKAVATLAYGQDSRQFVNSETSFWLIPWKILLLVILAFSAFAAVMTWGIKLYIRKMLRMAGVVPGEEVFPSPAKSERKVSVVAPLEEGILDLRHRMAASKTVSSKFAAVFSFVSQYKLFFALAGTAIVFIVLLAGYVRGASINERQYEVTVSSAGEDVTITSEDIKYNELKDQQVENQDEKKDVETSVVSLVPPIKIVNQSGVNGLAAELRLKLETAGYEVAELTNEMGSSENNTVIVYAPEYSSEALQLSLDVYGALTSSFDDLTDSQAPIVIYVGKDLENAR